MQTDWELIQACRAYDETAWTTLINRYERLLLAIALRHGMSRDDAEEMAQLTFTVFLENLNIFHPESNLKAWLATVTKRNCWRAFEQSDREAVGRTEDLMESAFSLGFGQEDERTDWDVITWLHDGLQAIDERCRELITTLFFSQKKQSYDEIGVQFGMPKNSVGAIRSRCLKRLKRELEKLGQS